MTSFAKRFFMTLLAYLGAWAVVGAASVAAAPGEEPGCPGPETAEALAPETVALVARTWAAPPEDIVLDWGLIPASVRARGGVPRRLLGRGQDGWLAVVVEPPGEFPVSVRLRAGVHDTVWVATRALAAGARLLAGDIRPQATVHWGPPAAPRVAPRAGWEVQSSVTAGEILRTEALRAPLAVDAGEPVRFLWTRGGVHIVLGGVALRAAREGELVSARVPGRSDPVTGIAVGPGTARLQGDLR